MKKVLALILALMLLLSLTACAQPAPTGGETAATADDSNGMRRVALLTAMASAESWQTRLVLVDDIAAQLNIEVTQLDSDGNVALQVSQIESVVEAGFDAIIISPAEAVAVIPALQMALERGIPVVSTEGVFYEGLSAAIVIPEYDAAYYLGQHAAEWLNTNWPDRTDLNVFNLAYDFLDTVIDRNDGMMDGVTNNTNANITVVGGSPSPTTTVEATNMSESALQGFDIDVCMAVNGDFLYGFVLAASALGRNLDEIAGFTMDATPASMDYLRQGRVIRGIVTWGTPRGQVEYWLQAADYVMRDGFDFSAPTREFSLDFLHINADNVDEIMAAFNWD